MKRSQELMVVALATVAVFACQDNVLTPMAPGISTSSSAASSFAGSENTERHVVTYVGYELSPATEALIANMGGQVSQLWVEFGVGLVDGLRDEDVAALAAQPDVANVSRDRMVQWVPTSNVYSAETIELAESDQSGAFFFNRFQWNMRQIDADDAWLTTTQGAGTSIAILDTGIDPFHIDLAGKVDPANSVSVLTPGSSPCGGFDEGTIFDLNFHGTFVGAITSSNGIGMASVAPDASVIGVKVLNCTGSGSFADVIAGIVHATNAGADVINMSLGALVPRQGAEALIDALQAAIDFASDNGTFVVASSGNDALNFDDLPDDLHQQQIMHVPSMLDNVLSVGATAPINQTNFDQLASYTNFGQSGLDVQAPGGDRLSGNPVEDLILSACSSFVCGASNIYVVSAGTSFSAPHAAGTAAVSIADGNDPDRCVERGADRITGRGNDPEYGRGRINVVGAATCERLTTDE